jgi:hypothetical protein
VSPLGHARDRLGAGVLWHLQRIESPLFWDAFAGRDLRAERRLGAAFGDLAAQEIRAPIIQIGRGDDEVAAR